MTADPESQYPKGLADEVQEIRSALQQLSEVTRLLSEAIRRAPIHMDVQHLQIERVEFHLDGIDVQELGGQLNIGITAMHKGQPVEAGAAVTSPPAQHPIWPPQRRGVEQNGQAGTDGVESGGSGSTPG